MTTRHAPFPPPTVPGLSEARVWGFDECSNMILGLALRHAALRPCSGPFPCGEFDYEPRFPELVSVHPVRGIDRVSAGTNPYPNQEVCRYHFGVALGMRHDGLLQPIVCVMPNLLDKGHQPLTNPEPVIRKQVCVGAFFVAQRSDPTGTLKAGMMYAVVGAPDPPWMAGVFEADRVGCNIPI